MGVNIILLSGKKKSHADYAKFAKTMQSIYPFSIKDFAKTYIASLVCNHPDGKAQAERVPSAYFYSACKDIPHGICALCALCVRIKYNDISERLQCLFLRTHEPYIPIYQVLTSPSSTTPHKHLRAGLRRGRTLRGHHNRGRG